MRIRIRNPRTCQPWIRDGKNRIPWIRDKHSGSATLQQTVKLNEMANVDLKSKDETSMIASKYVKYKT
jgi:hypothetical protein